MTAVTDRASVRSDWLGCDRYVRADSHLPEVMLGEGGNLALPQFLRSIEDSSFSVWMRESDSPFTFYLVLLFHTFGLSLLVGANALVDVRLLGFFKSIPIAPLKRFFRIMWIGFWMNATTGALLLISYPTKALTNPVFYTKLVIIGFAIWILMKLEKEVFTGTATLEADMIARGATLAKWSLALWVGAISAGRLLAYTFKYITFPS
jgi:hypothetical protein